MYLSEFALRSKNLLTRTFNLHYGVYHDHSSLVNNHLDREELAMHRLFMSVLVAAITAGIVGFGVPAHASRESQDPDYQFSVVDVESPDQVIQRARAVLGSRYVDTWISEDQHKFVIGVHNLTEEERSRLENRIQSEADIVLVDRDVSRKQLDEFAKNAETEFDEAGVIFSAIATDYSAGALVVSPLDGKMDEILDAAEDQPELEDAIVASTEFPALEDGLVEYQPGKPRLVVLDSTVSEQESASANPYRAGKYLAVGSTTHNCTASFTVTKGGARYGLTAGHCTSVNRAKPVYFAGVKRGTTTNNTLWATTPAKSDAVLFKMAKNSTGTLYRSASLNRRVSGYYQNSQIVKGLRVCTRGAFSGQQSCGPITQTGVRTWSGTAKRYVSNGVAWKWDPYGTRGGDSGAPVYRVLADGSVKAVGVHRAGNKSNTSYFTPIATVLSTTGTKLVTG